MEGKAGEGKRGRVKEGEGKGGGRAGGVQSPVPTVRGLDATGWLKLLSIPKPDIGRKSRLLPSWEHGRSLSKYCHRV